MAKPRRRRRAGRPRKVDAARFPGGKLRQDASAGPTDELLAKRAGLAAALIALARHGIQPDIQELLVRGNPDLKVPPGALAAALKAANAELQAEIDALKHDVERHMQIAADLASESITREK